MGAYCTSLSTVIEVLQPGKAELISRLAVIADSNYPASRYIVIPGSLVELSS